MVGADASCSLPHEAQKRAPGESSAWHREQRRGMFAFMAKRGGRGGRPIGSFAQRGLGRNLKCDARSRRGPPGCARMRWNVG